MIVHKKIDVLLPGIGSALIVGCAIAMPVLVIDPFHNLKLAE